MSKILLIILSLTVAFAAGQDCVCSFCNINLNLQSGRSALFVYGSACKSHEAFYIHQYGIRGTSGVFKLSFITYPSYANGSAI